MSDITDPRAIATALTLATILIGLLRRQDPAQLLSVALYAIRRAIVVAGDMLLDLPCTFVARWKAGRPSDAAELAELEQRYPAGASE